MLRGAYNQSSAYIHRCWYSSSISKEINQILKQMSKLPGHDAILRREQSKLKRKAQKQHPPGKISIQVLGTGARGGPASIYLFTDQTRYLINCGEGTQRLAHEHRLGLSRLDHIFLTRTSWKHIGGLPGLSLTLQDAGTTNLTLYGPPKLGEIFTAMRRFIVLRKLQVDAPVCDEGKFYEDSVIKMTYVPLERKANRKSGAENEIAPTIELTEDDNIDYYAHEANDGKSPEVCPVSHLSHLEKSEETAVMAYICELKPKLGTLSLERCVDKGVPPGPLLGKLKNGEDIILANGETVLAADVRDPDDPGPVILVIDTPSCEYFESLTRNDALKTYQNEDDANRLQLIVHFTPEDVANSKEYKEFFNQFPTKTKHWFINERNKSTGNVSAHRIQWQLNQLSDEIFPILSEPIEKCASIEDDSPHKRFKLEEKHEIAVDSKDLELPTDTIVPLTRYNLRPNTGLDRNYEVYVTPQEYIHETAKSCGFPEALVALKETQKSLLPSSQSDRQQEFPKFVFLGTGSCIPNKTRNVSSILVHTSNENSILLDCGEGSAGQIQRFYGSRANEIFKRIKCIAVTHLHADHHLGLLGILQARRRILGDSTTPVLLLAPLPMGSWLNYYDHRIETIKNDYVLVPNNDLLNAPLTDRRVTDLGLRSFQTCFVLHCLHAYAFSFVIEPKSGNKSDQPIKITYSGDTMPCESLVNLGLNSTVLIHEATMEDNLVDDAKAKAHSTTSQALEQARLMNAKYTILTHFSQRYAKMPQIENDLENVGIAFDNMEVILSDFKQLEIMYPTLKCMFSDALDELKRKTNSRILRKELQSE